MDVTRFEQGLLEPKYDHVSLPKLASNCIDVVRYAADKKSIELQLLVDKVVPEAAYVLGDERRLHQLVLNLLNNAIKFTPNGGRVSLGLAMQLQPGRDAPTLLLTVSDTGVGIPECDLGLIFLKYTKATDASLTSTGGDERPCRGCPCASDSEGWREGNS